HLINYIEGADFVPNPDVLSGNNWEDKVTEGSGSSKGIELLVRKQDVQNTAWLSYTLSESRRQFAEINGGQYFPFRFDLRHAFHLVYARKLDKHWSLSAAWAFRSGSHINLALNEWQYVSQDGSPDFIYQNFGGKNSYTLPPYHRLDISARYKKEKPWGHWSFDVGIYNLYNRKNIYFIKSDFQPGTKTLGYKAVSLIPVLPYFSIDIYL
ncbi:MAG TPA: TonB-dependent receptor, partial [Phaeodactylibacter sp.]|nr:TonB-dependent receptor [Phaeodactylibacter sp.]